MVKIKAGTFLFILKRSLKLQWCLQDKTWTDVITNMINCNERKWEKHSLKGKRLKSIYLLAISIVNMASLIGNM